MISFMSTEDLEAEALKLTPRERARLAERLLQSLENLSDEENAGLWAAEAERRDIAWDANPSIGGPADDVLRDARARLDA
jgi:putative addiction module component (TIGR02574 family)